MELAPTDFGVANFPIYMFNAGTNSRMPQESANRLVEYLNEQAGEYLRGAIHYSADDYFTLYLRDDIKSLYPPEKLDELARYYRQEELNQASDEPFNLGTNHCGVKFYDETILFHFTQGENVGTVITLEPEAGRDIVAFISECLEQLHHNSPQEIVDAPTWLDD